MKDPTGGAQQPAHLPDRAAVPASGGALVCGSQAFAMWYVPEPQQVHDLIRSPARGRGKGDRTPVLKGPLPFLSERSYPPVANSVASLRRRT
jgi:hypothetical protein